VEQLVVEELLDERTKAIQLDPDYAEAYYNRGVSYRALGQNQLADADKTMACSLDTQTC
jgi:Tfp pilus assembly protein PilF